MSQFNPEVFLDATITEVQVKLPPLPAGADFIGVVGEPKMRVNQGKKDPTQTYTSADYPIVLDTSSVEGQPPTKTLTYSIMLDITDAGTIDLAPGKNGRLRRFREAVGMNAPGSPFNFRQAQGKSVRAKIGHRPYEGEIFDEIADIAKA